MNQLLQKIQNNLAQNFINMNVEHLDIFIYYQIIYNVLSTINSILPNCQLDKNAVSAELKSDYILLITNEPIKSFHGKLAVLISFKNFLINTLEVSVMY